MSSRQRLLVVAAAVVVAVIAFVAVRPGDDDNDKTKASSTTAEQRGGTTTEADQVTPAPPPAERIVIRDNKVVGGQKRIEVTKGDRVRIVVSADAKDDLHLHGYDIEKTVLPGRPATFAFEASIEGRFELESHTAEDLGLEAVVANILVEPS
jgi:hypothetical protein